MRIRSNSPFVLGAAALLLLVATAAEAAQRGRDPTKKMKCTPTILIPDSTLQILLPFPHGPYLTVVGPKDREYLFVIYPMSDWSQVPAEKFLDMKSYERKVSDIKASDGLQLRNAFVEPGKYLITVGDGYESESQYDDGWCYVTYRGRRN